MTTELYSKAKAATALPARLTRSPQYRSLHASIAQLIEQHFPKLACARKPLIIVTGYKGLFMAWLGGVGGGKW